ncbi:MAG: PH domain-containing protein [bacterium]|nr:PH domain-containing protein [bacterium]
MAKDKNEMSFRGQHENEEVLLMFRKHPVVMRKGLIYGSLGLLLGTVPSLINPTMTLLWLGLLGGFFLACLIMFPYWIAWYYSMFIITNERYIQLTQKGLFNRSVSDLSLKQIQSLNYQVAGIEQTLLGFGTIVMQTYLGDIVIHDVHHPEKTINELSDLLNEYGNLQDTSELNQVLE